MSPNYVEKYATTKNTTQKKKKTQVIFESNNMLAQDKTITPKIVVSSYSMSKILLSAGNFKDRAFQMCVVDESHTLRNNFHTKKPAKETEKLISFISKIEKIILLSGTPHLNNYLDIYCQANLLSPNLLGSYDDFFQNYDIHTLEMSKRQFMSPGKCRKSYELGLLLREFCIFFF